jgi:hypothetical protein
MINPTIKYPRPTMLRSKRIGTKLGTVVSVSNEPFAVWFQLYETGGGRGPFYLMVEDRYDTEQKAFDKFDAWVVEAERLPLPGDDA